MVKCNDNKVLNPIISSWKQKNIALPDVNIEILVVCYGKILVTIYLKY